MVNWSIVEICRKTQNFYELEVRKLNTNLSEIVALKVLRDMMESKIFMDLIDHPRGVNVIEDHRYQLIKKVCHSFIKAKSRHFSNRFNLNIHKKLLRHKLTHEIKFAGQ